jgi:hypothetical protein
VKTRNASLLFCLNRSFLRYFWKKVFQLDKLFLSLYYLYNNENYINNDCPFWLQVQINFISSPLTNKLCSALPNQKLKENRNIKSIKEKMLKPKNQTLKQTKTFFSSKNPSDFTLTHHSLTLRNSLRDNSSLR